MAIYRLIASGSFGPDEIDAMTEAYERALTYLGMVDRTIRSRNLSPKRLST